MTQLWSFYLPQFHPIPENDRWWGKGFTEWTNVKTARPQFAGHYQPHRPDPGLGYYDLREPEVMVRQAELARKYGIYGFVFYHYWFEGRRLLERPAASILENKRFKLPFCFCWANENWSRRWDGMDDDVIMRQTYSAEDDLAHIRELISYFKDERYYKHRGRPVLLVYRSEDLSDPEQTADIWRREVRKAGFPDIYLLRVEGITGALDPADHGFDAAVEFAPDWRCLTRRVFLDQSGFCSENSDTAVPGSVSNRVFLYEDVVRAMLAKEEPSYKRYSCVFPAWDNTARRRDLSATIIHGGTPERYRNFLTEAIRRTRKQFAADDRLVFVNAWNEWGEGCHLEPDLHDGLGLLEATRAAVREEDAALLSGGNVRRRRPDFIWRLRELLRAPFFSVWRERGRRWSYQLKGFRGVRNYRRKFEEKAAICSARLFNFGRYKQEFFGEGPLLTLLVDCRSNGDPFDFCRRLKEQSWSRFELFFLVDGGDRELRRQLEAVIAEEGLSGWRVLVAGPSDSEGIFNRALSLATGKYVVSLFGGDQLIPTFLEECLLSLEAAPPHYFLVSANQPAVASETEIKTVDPLAGLEEYLFRVVAFPRASGLAVGGYDEILEAGSARWEFYLKLVRRGSVGQRLGCRLGGGLVRDAAENQGGNGFSPYGGGLVCDAEEFENSVVGARAEKKPVQDRHRDYLRKRRYWLYRRARQYWQVTGSLVNFPPLPEVEKQERLWLDLGVKSRVPAILYARLMAPAAAAGPPLLVTIDKARQTFFCLNKSDGLHVYQPEAGQLQRDREFFDGYLSRRYKLRQIQVEDFLRLSANKVVCRRDRLRILYAAPWLITGGADAMTVDWFRRLEPEWCDKYLVTTIFRDNNWFHKIVDYARGIYDLPALGCLTPAAITAFLLEFIDLYNIDILHIMNSEMVYAALPEIKARFPELKVVAQFHCFDYSPAGRRGGYALTVPPGCDQFIDAYNLEYSRLGEELLQLYPALEKTKFKVIYGRVDCDFYDPCRRPPQPEVAARRRLEALNLLFIGRLDRQKQPLRLLEIAAGLRERKVPFVLHVIGDGSLESQKKRFLSGLRERGLEESVRFYGEQPSERLYDWYLISDILLLPSDWEGVPMVLYQAMAMGLVPVVADVGGCSELVNPASGCLIKERDDCAAYCRAVAGLADEKRRRQLGARARQRMQENFSLTELDSEYRALYENLGR